jgi:hypothetical protein
MVKVNGKHMKCLDEEDLLRIQEAIDTSRTRYQAKKQDHFADEDERREASIEVMKLTLLKDRVMRLESPLCGKSKLY